jgi:hypothetical protein
MAHLDDVLDRLLGRRRIGRITGADDMKFDASPRNRSARAIQHRDNQMGATGGSKIMLREAAWMANFTIASLFLVGVYRPLQVPTAICWRQSLRS